MSTPDGPGSPQRDRQPGGAPGEESDPARPGLAPTPLPLAVFRDLCLDAVDPTAVGAFWAAVLGRSVQDAGQGDGSSRDVYLQATGDGGPHLYVNGVAAPTPGKTRVHLDVTLRPGQEITDLLALGATVVSEPDEVRWWVLADPGGTEFCAFPPEATVDNDADAEIPVTAPPAGDGAVDAVDG